MRERLRGVPPRLGFLARLAGLLLAFFGADRRHAGRRWSVEGRHAPELGNRKQGGGRSAREHGGCRKELDPGQPDADASFLHRATDGNSHGDYTYLANDGIGVAADAVVLVEMAPDGGSAGAAHEHNAGVWYEPAAGRWAVFNQDLAPIRDGAAFNVSVANAAGGG